MSCPRTVPVSVSKQNFVRAFGRTAILLSLCPVRQNASVAEKGGSRRHTPHRDPMWPKRLAAGSFGACPGHSSTAIGASSAPNSYISAC
jgi:hypothetical protein